MDLIGIYKRKTATKVKYLDLLDKFTEQFVTESENKDLICKSCGFQINLKKYVEDGYFQNDRYVSFGSPLDIPIEEIPEYQKYLTIVIGVTKLIERIALITNIPYLLTTTKNKNKSVNNLTKFIIDLLIANNKVVNSTRDLKMYGINKDLTNLIAFELTNDIFTKKDYYNSIKINNIIIYITLSIILD